MKHGADEWELRQRQDAFNRWLRTYGQRIGYYQLQPSVQGVVHAQLRKAFNAGYNEHKRQQEPVRCGGEW